jgi:hypothetical protein
MKVLYPCPTTGSMKGGLPSSVIGLLVQVKTQPPMGAIFLSRCSLRISSRTVRKVAEIGIARFSFVLVSSANSRMKPVFRMKPVLKSTLSHVSPLISPALIPVS